MVKFFFKIYLLHYIATITITIIIIIIINYKMLEKDFMNLLNQLFINMMEVF